MSDDSRILERFHNIAGNGCRGFVAVLQGANGSRSLMVTQLFGTTGVAVCLLLSVALQNAAIVDVALALAPLAVVTTAAFTRFYWSAPSRSPDRRKIDG
jgi:multisubunit Na+/H+ antiporter MnhF subunit